MGPYEIKWNQAPQKLLCDHPFRPIIDYIPHQHFSCGCIILQLLTVVCSEHMGTSFGALKLSLPVPNVSTFCFLTVSAPPALTPAPAVLQGHLPTALDHGSSRSLPSMWNAWTTDNWAVLVSALKKHGVLICNVSYTETTPLLEGKRSSEIMLLKGLLRPGWSLILVLKV
jgi:hypothetical protein